MECTAEDDRRFLERIRKGKYAEGSYFIEVPDVTEGHSHLEKVYQLPEPSKGLPGDTQRRTFAEDPMRDEQQQQLPSSRPSSVRYTLIDSSNKPHCALISSQRMAQTPCPPEPFYRVNIGRNGESLSALAMTHRYLALGENGGTWYPVPPEDVQGITRVDTEEVPEEAKEASERWSHEKGKPFKIFDYLTLELKESDINKYKSTQKPGKSKRRSSKKRRREDSSAEATSNMADTNCRIGTNQHQQAHHQQMLEVFLKCPYPLGVSPASEHGSFPGNGQYGKIPPESAAEEQSAQWCDHNYFPLFPPKPGDIQYTGASQGQLDVSGSFQWPIGNEKTHPPFQMTPQSFIPPVLSGFGDMNLQSQSTYNAPQTLQPPGQIGSFGDPYMLVRTPTSGQIDLSGCATFQGTLVTDTWPNVDPTQHTVQPYTWTPEEWSENAGPHPNTDDSFGPLDPGHSWGASIASPTPPNQPPIIASGEDAQHWNNSADYSFFTQDTAQAYPRNATDWSEQPVPRQDTAVESGRVGLSDGWELSDPNAAPLFFPQPSIGDPSMVHSPALWRTKSE